ncbi:MAG: LysR family transcriptional regulator [Rhizobiales bacterium]|nr:LysR family transcriptional regulator [Hyphomicrobiales bacterium]
MPKLDELLAFDAAARASSFTRAARELNVQQPAVSRRIAQLEVRVGTDVNVRYRRPGRRRTQHFDDMQCDRLGTGQCRTCLGPAFPGRARAGVGRTVMPCGDTLARPHADALVVPLAKTDKPAVRRSIDWVRWDAAERLHALSTKSQR